jgi:hypothetical protein
LKKNFPKKTFQEKKLSQPSWNLVLEAIWPAVAQGTVVNATDYRT